MKQILFLTLSLFILVNVSGQIDGFFIDNEQHVAFKYDGGNPWLDETSHWTPGNIQFWSDNTYSTGNLFNPFVMTLFDPDQFMDVNVNGIKFAKMQGGPFFIDRVKLDYDGLDIVNGASWQSLNAYVYGNGGQIDLFTGVNGNYLVRLGSTSMNSLKGSLRIYGSGGGARIIDLPDVNNAGIRWYYGPNNFANLYIGRSADANDGRIIIYDNTGTQQAGIYVDGANNGIVWGDTKSFRVKHPDKTNTEIWYASLEGPEAGAYERGTARLVNGEAFIEFSDHYQIIANERTMTLNLTPLEWDTYGLAVVEKTSTGFRVKELKGGTGNFEFDWEVKCVRKGKEKFKVIRAADENLPPAPHVSDDSAPQTKIKGNMKRNTLPVHSHSPDCVHNKK